MILNVFLRYYCTVVGRAHKETITVITFTSFNFTHGLWKNNYNIIIIVE